MISRWDGFESHLVTDAVISTGWCGQAVLAAAADTNGSIYLVLMLLFVAVVVIGTLDIAHSLTIVDQSKKA